MADEKTVELWERQPGEGTKPWEAFVIYRDMGTDRALRKVAKQLQKSITMIGRWSSDWKWQERVAAWDAEQDKLARADQVKEIAKMRKLQAQRGAKMQEKAMAALEQMEIEELSAADVVRLMTEGAKLERLGRGDVGEVIEERDGGKSEPPVTFYIPKNGRDE